MLTLASLVQAEGRHPEDFGKIARVLDNRIAAKRNLELDTTLHYALNRFTVFTSNKDTKFAVAVQHVPAPRPAPGADRLAGARGGQGRARPDAGAVALLRRDQPEHGRDQFAVTDADRQKLLAEYNAWQKAHPGQ